MIAAPAVQDLVADSDRSRTCIRRIKICHALFQSDSCRKQLESRSRFIHIGDQRVSPHLVPVCHLFVLRHAFKLLLFFFVERSLRIIQVEFRCLRHCQDISGLRIHDYRHRSLRTGLLLYFGYCFLRVMLYHLIYCRNDAVSVLCIVMLFFAVCQAVPADISILYRPS